MNGTIRFGLRYISVEATVTVCRNKRRVVLIQTIWIGPFRNLKKFAKWSTTFREALKQQRYARCKEASEHIVSPSAAAHIVADMDPESLPFDAAHDLYTFVIEKEEKKKTAQP